MADERSHSAVILICGIPASGKTTFTTDLRWYLQKTKGDSVHTINVCYDDFIPSDLDVYGSSVAKHHQNNLEEMPDENSIEINSSKYSLWKKFRKLALDAVEKVMNMIENNLKKDETDESKTEGEELGMEGLPSFQEFWRIFVQSISMEERKCSCIAVNDWRWNGCPHIILVDDNMFYHSMRYEYVQMARKYSAGFAEVFLKCSLEIAETRNSLRSHPVASDTMRNMFSKMEPPEPEKFPWEQYSLTIKAEEELDVEIMESVAHFAMESLKHPMLQPVEDIEEKERSRAACITSIVHQADQVLRKYISKLIAMAKGSGEGKKELQSLARQLNKDKKVFLESIHNIKSHSECCRKFKTDLKASKTFEGVISSSGCFTERTLKESSKESSCNTLVQNDKTTVGENDVQGCFANSMANNVHSGYSRSHLCLQCFPNVEDKEEFKSFVEELFLGSGQLYAQVNNKVK